MPKSNSAVQAQAAAAAPNTTWSPAVGAETTRFLNDRVPEPARAVLSSTALSILSKSVEPGAEGLETGLVIGYVQSGKTMSFETVTTLAHDNAFPIVIVLAGVTSPLLNQSTGRLRKDLGIDDTNRPRKWIQLENPINDETTVQAIKNTLEDWADASTPAELKKTILITVLKHHQRLRNLTELLDELNLDSVGVLIIDDEADQVSLNSEAAQGEESSTYKRLIDLRDALPSHTYLQYTATPQAPLLINIADALSPNFVEVLETGNEYVGGKDFFGTTTQYTKLIPIEEVPTNDNPLIAAPVTLLQALRSFMVGVACGLIQNGGIGNRSMMVHPSFKTLPHQEFLGWVSDSFEEWKQILASDGDSAEKQSLLEDFEVSYNDLKATVGDSMPAFADVAKNLKAAFRNTRILEVNARQGKTPVIDWSSSYGWILVGGAAMDRGFTIEGLTITYMPRGIGNGNADTIQQRARFFGYKRKYLGYCRVYLEQGTLDAFKNYVEHEEDIRAQLKKLQQEGKSLNEWKRAFILDVGLKPCRDSVLAFDYMRGKYGNDWFSPRVVVAGDDILDNNRQVVSSFMGATTFTDDNGHADRTEPQKHHVAELPLKKVLEDLLVGIKVPSTTDSKNMTGLLLQISKALQKEPNLMCSVYVMSPNAPRTRGADEEGKILNLFQGEYPVMPKEERGTIYPGDRRIKSDANLTVQIHRLTLTQENQDSIDDVPVIAIWVPENLAKGWLVQ